jgi:uncharacterized protein YyaL (SSP411 family)
MMRGLRRPRSARSVGPRAPRRPRSARRGRGAALRREGLVAALAAAALIAVASGAAEPPVLGFPHHPPELRARLAAALADRSGSYDPRTRHLGPDGRPRFTNRLLLEDSPYLRQHAHNPVDWSPWGAEALARAKREDKPVFLSIGYSTCHWCHVMERESFDELAIAELLNAGFVAIKVDREQRPDLDDIYMTAVQLSGRDGGWPLTAFLTPEGKPFFGTTYVPPERFAEMLRAVTRVWKEDRAEIETTAGALADAVREVSAGRAEAAEVGQEATSRAVAELLRLEDRVHGGIGGAPKFPHEPALLFLLDLAQRGQSAEAGAAAERALDAMARGGIHDQVAGGFHRYATDAQWRVPHFEKMLYNQAQLARAYVAGYRLTGRPSFRRAAATTLDAVLREMTSPEGGFYSATDADSEGEEGRFFVWSPQELERALGAEDARWAARVFGVDAAGNFEGGRTVLHLPEALDDVAREDGVPLEESLERLDAVRERLRSAREARPKPLRDDKVLTAWNAMTITALVEGHAALHPARIPASGATGGPVERARAAGGPGDRRRASQERGAGGDAGDGRWLLAAERAAEHLWTTARRAPKRLWRVRLEGSSSVEALLEDHAFLAEALLTLYDATGERRWLERAVEVLEGMLEQFWDEEGGGFFLGAAAADAPLIARPKSPADGAVPSGNSAALRALAMAWQRTGDVAYRDRADALVRAFSGLIQRAPASFPYLLYGRSELLAGDTGPRSYAARGKVAARAAVARGRESGELRLALDLDVAPGWHINSFAPLDESLVATRVEVAEETGWRLVDLESPEPQKVRLGFQKDPLSVYTGQLRLDAIVAPAASGSPSSGSASVAPLAVDLRIQACDDSVCLRPEEVRVRAPVASLVRPAGAPF